MKKTNQEILIVDDDPGICTLAGIFLKEAGFNVSTSPDGAKCLELLASGIKPDLILADIMMPLMNGYDLCRHIKKQKNTTGIPVVFFSALPSEEIEKEYKSTGASGYIIKGFKFENLSSQVARFL